MPRKQIIVQQGASFAFGFQVLDEVGGECVARDLTGWTARMQVREDYASTSPLLSLDTQTGGGITITNAEGRVSISASPAQTAGLPAPAALVYDVEGVRADGFVERWLEGVARVTPEVTR